MKKLTLLSLLALALVACNKGESVPADNTGNEPQAVAFDGYLNRGVATRSGAAGALDANELQKTGFGVFAYYTNASPYDQEAVPNFMYNQQVTHDHEAHRWTYVPVTYWPNEYGSTAASDDVDKVSFFAYAPYVDSTPSTGKVADDTYGITGMNPNSAKGDMLIRYKGSFDPAKSVDLCWGVTSSTDATSWDIIQTGEAQSGIVPGKPWLNVQRPKDLNHSQKLRFTFNHALSQLNVQIDADVDITNHAGTPELANNTKIYVRSVSFTGFSMKGALNLNNSVADKAEWMDYTGIGSLTSNELVVLHDGRRDGREGAVGALAGDEKTLGMNPNIISDDGNTTPGVTASLVNLFNSSTLTTPVCVIPIDEPIGVTISYDVETEDPKLLSELLSDNQTHGSRINNVISVNNITFGDATRFESGKAYTLILHLGMNSVKLTASISDWDTSVSNGETNLPGPA